MIQAIVRNGVVLATHQVEQNVLGRYPAGSEIVCYNGHLNAGAVDPRLTNDPLIVSCSKTTRQLWDDAGKRWIVQIKNGKIETVAG